MRGSRSRRLGRFVAVLLLLWTTVDLVNASACALENEQRFAFSGVAHPIVASPERPGVQQAHVDDCFCCSHCVDVEPLALPSGLPVNVRRQQFRPSAHPDRLPLPLYHPPQASV